MKLPELNKRLVLPAASSIYPTLGASYKQGAYEISHTGRLVRTDKHYYDSKAGIPEGLRMTTAGEELAIQLKYEKVANIIRRTDEREILGKNPSELADELLKYASTEDEREAISYVFREESDAMNSVFAQTNGILIPDPRKSVVFDDLFARGPEKIYMWQWTETGLRVPKGREADRYETDAHGRKYWVRIALVGDKEEGEVLVPEGNGRLAVELDEVFGIPRVTEDMNWPHKPYTTYFWFNATPDLDGTSGHYDVAVGRRSGWHLDERCLGVVAYFRRWDAYSADGFRPVRGSLPKIEKELVEK